MTESVSPLISQNLIFPKTLGDRRRLVSFGWSLLIQEITRREFFAAFDTVKTDATGQGHLATGCHPMGLAADILLYSPQMDYLTDSSDYKQFGDYWKLLHPLFRFGGDFSNPDGNHFSILALDGIHQ